MKLFTSKKKKALRQTPKPNRAEALACIPEIVPQAQWQQGDSGEVFIEYPFVVKPLLQAIFRRFGGDNQQKLTRKLQLDEFGSLVWRSIDGEKSVAEIIEEFAGVSDISIQEAELSVTTFLRELGKRGLIIIR